MKLTRRTRQGSGGKFEHYSDWADLYKGLWRVDWKDAGYPYCGIYVITADNGWPCKIGISQNPVKRLLSLQSANWRKIDIQEYRYCENAVQARAVEQKAHEMLHGDGKSLLGEWFDCRPDQAIEVIQFAADVLGVSLRTDIPDERIRETLLQMADYQYTAEYAKKEANKDRRRRMKVPNTRGTRLTTLETILPRVVGK